MPIGAGMKQPVDFIHGNMRVHIYYNESGKYALKFYYNNIKVDISLYDLDAQFLQGLQTSIGEFLGSNSQAG